jgi:hypothetical protein
MITKIDVMTYIKRIFEWNTSFISNKSI